MKLISSKFDGVFLLENEIHRDSRGYFFEAFNRRDFKNLTGLDVDFIQDNQSSSSYGVLRGLHFQKGSAAQAKLIRVLRGRVLDVCVDLRAGSPTLGQWEAFELSESNLLQLFLPRGFAHGFCVLSESADFLYKCDNYYDPSSEGTMDALDPDLGIDWRLDPQCLIRSDKDLRAPKFKDLDPSCFYEF